MNRKLYNRIKFFCSLLLLASFAGGLGAKSKVVFAAEPAFTADGQFTVHLRYQKEVAPGASRWHRLVQPEQWAAERMAIIVCDMWDSHHCVNAVRRVGELSPRMNALLKECRAKGATIIHAPSGCMSAYTDHPARLRAQAVKPAASIPADIGQWCDKIDSEANCPYPIDQAAGGEDDQWDEHQQWAATLKAAGLNPRAPWTRQTPALTIDPLADFISDSGPEIWSILEDRAIQHVALVGVHTNMCVLGRPFGLRQLAVHGKQVALIRDMTDTMYDPRCWPYVSHFTGTDLIVDHIERSVCSTFTSVDILGGSEFRFSADRRPTLAILMAEDEYATETTLPEFAAVHLGQYRLNLIYGDEQQREKIPGLAELAHADALLISVRRRPLPRADLELIKSFVASGKPTIGIRTASHAFSLRKDQPTTELASWPEVDREVWGGNYTNHYGNDLHPQIDVVENPSDGALAQSLQGTKFVSGGSLYKVMPLGPGTQPLLMGVITGQPAEPVAWTNVRTGGGRSFYTSLGHKEDFKQSQFRLLLANGIHWACNQPLVSLESIEQARLQYAQGSGKQR